MTARSEVFPLDGGCDCGLVRYRMQTVPLFVHCCHCRWCQRETGASFALNALIEADRVVHLNAEPEIVDTPSNSGKGQHIARCPKCRIALWSNYFGGGPLLRFVRVGTLDEPDHLPPRRRYACSHNHKTSHVNAGRGRLRVRVLFASDGPQAQRTPGA